MRETKNTLSTYFLYLIEIKCFFRVFNFILTLLFLSFFFFSTLKLYGNCVRNMRPERCSWQIWVSLSLSHFSCSSSFLYISCFLSVLLCVYFEYTGHVRAREASTIMASLCWSSRWDSVCYRYV